MSTEQNNAAASAAAGASETKKPEKKVKIRVLRDCMVGDMIYTPGTIVEATESQAAELCDKGFDGYQPYYGYAPEIGPLMGVDSKGQAIPNPLERRKIYRAERVA